MGFCRVRHTVSLSDLLSNLVCRCTLKVSSQTSPSSGCMQKAMPAIIPLSIDSVVCLYGRLRLSDTTGPNVMKREFLTT